MKTLLEVSIMKTLLEVTIMKTVLVYSIMKTVSRTVQVSILQMLSIAT